MSSGSEQLPELTSPSQQRERRRTIGDHIRNALRNDKRRSYGWRVASCYRTCHDPAMSTVALAFAEDGDLLAVTIHEASDSESGKLHVVPPVDDVMRDEAQTTAASQDELGELVRELCSRLVLEQFYRWRQYTADTTTTVALTVPGHQLRTAAGLAASAARLNDTFQLAMRALMDDLVARLLAVYARQLAQLVINDSVVVISPTRSEHGRHGRVATTTTPLLYVMATHRDPTLKVPPNTTSTSNVQLIFPAGRAPPIDETSLRARWNSLLSQLALNNGQPMDICASDATVILRPIPTTPRVSFKDHRRWYVCAHVEPHVLKVDCDVAKGVNDVVKRCVDHIRSALHVA